jgi:hypothetical protein
MMTYASPPIKKKSAPKALNISSNRCAYCGKFQADSYQISVSMGIAACVKHAEWAKWDCKTYMHTEGQARLEDGLIYPAISSFINALHALPDGFSDGETGGWQLMKSNKPFFLLVDGAWTIPVYNESLSTAKRIAINRFHSDEDMLTPILDKVPLQFPDYVQFTINLLNWGIYSDYDRITGNL